MNSRLFFIISILVITINSFAQTGLYVPQLAKFDTAMLNLMSEYNVPGGQLAITYHGRLVYNRGLASMTQQYRIQFIRMIYFALPVFQKQLLLLPA